MLCPEEECSIHLRATLAHFRSYCQKNSKSSIRKAGNSSSNQTLTKYRSIRQLKKMGKNSQPFLKSPYKKKTEFSPVKVEEEQLVLRNSDLIEMIKIKLRQNGQLGKKLKTENNLKEGNESICFQKKTTNLATNFLHSFKFAKSSKKNKIDLTVRNTRCEILHKKQDPQTNSPNKEVIIALKARPNSAVGYRTTVGSIRGERQIRHKMSGLCSKYSVKQQEAIDSQKKIVENKDLSAWQIEDMYQWQLEHISEIEKQKFKKKQKNGKI